MKRPILIATIGYIIGILWGLYLKSIVPFIIFSILILIIFKNKIRKYKQIILLILISSIISNTQINILNNKYNNLYKNINEVKVIGTIVSEPQEKEYKTVYKIKVESINGNSKYKNTYLLLNIKNINKPKVEYGNKITFNGTYIEPQTQRNYKGFDYKEYLKTIQVYGSVTLDSEVRILEHNNINIIYKTINNIKQNINENLNELLPEETRYVCLGILIGDTENITDELKEKFKTSSLYHLLAVSGSNITYIIIATAFILQKINLNKRISKIFTIIIIIFFMILTGLSASVVRAGFMGIILIGAGLFYRKLDIATSISLSLLISLINNPFSINDNGLLLSYGGTIGIVLFEKKFEGILKINEQILIEKKKVFINKIKTNIKQMLAVTCSAQVIIIPIMIVKFNTISFTFFISNILAGFFIGFIAICGYVLVIVSFIFKDLAKCGFLIYNLILKLFLYLIEFCSKIPLSQISVKTPNIILVILYYAIILLIRFQIIKLENIKKHYKKIIATILIFSLIVNLINIIPTNLKIHFIDVGQGDATLIITPTNKKILIDSGGSKDLDTFDVGESTLVPYLLNRGIDTLDYIIISHFDADHCNGFIAVLNKINVKKVIISKQSEISNEYKKFISIVKEKNIPVQIVKKGDKIQFDKFTYINILYPTENLKFDNLNNNSIVFRLIYGKFSILFTGDIEEKAEEHILDLYKNTNLLKSTILKAAHHGSKTSSTQEFIEAVNPKFVLIGVGENNTFGHPSEEVINRFKNLRCKNI